MTFREGERSGLPDIPGIQGQELLSEQDGFLTCILDLYNCTGTAQVCKNQFSQCKYDLEVSEGLESTDSKQTSSGGAASSQQFDANRDIQIMNIEDKNTAQGSSNKDDDNDEDDDEVTNDNDATGVVETDNDNAITEDKPIFDGNTPSLADGAG